MLEFFNSIKKQEFGANFHANLITFRHLNNWQLACISSVLSNKLFVRLLTFFLNLGREINTSITKNLTLLEAYNIMLVSFILDSLIVILVLTILTHFVSEFSEEGNSEIEVVDTSEMDEDWYLITLTTAKADEVCIGLLKHFAK